MIQFLTWDGRVVTSRGRVPCIARIHHEAKMVGPFPLSQWVVKLDAGGPRFTATRMIDAVTQARTHLREHQP
jgi:hypothetical protein